MKKAHDLTGQRFGRLVVIERVESHIQPSGQRKTRWLCQCDCGNTKIVQYSQLKSGKTKSCGCLAREKSKKRLITHGLSHTRLFIVWTGIKARCFNSKVIYYKDYGGRGIKMCEEWEKDFMAFKEWALTHGYDEKAERGECTIDRIDVNGDYSPDNCRFINMQEQCNNKRNNRLIAYEGKTYTIQQWCKILGIKYTTLKSRLNLGWPIEKALTTPLRGNK